jgi:hypothetical protein
LCHVDIHAGNLHLRTGGAGGPISMYIVDLDNPCFAPKEHDLALIGGCHLWSDRRQQALFYQGYGAIEVDRPALEHYFCERIM